MVKSCEKTTEEIERITGPLCTKIGRNITAVLPIFANSTTERLKDAITAGG